MSELRRYFERSSFTVFSYASFLALKMPCTPSHLKLLNCLLKFYKKSETKSIALN